MRWCRDGEAAEDSQQAERLRLPRMVAAEPIRNQVMLTLASGAALRREQQCSLGSDIAIWLTARCACPSGDILWPAKHDRQTTSSVIVSPCPSRVTARPAICLNVIVRDEAHIIHKALDSVAHYISRPSGTCLG